MSLRGGAVLRKLEDPTFFIIFFLDSQEETQQSMHSNYKSQEL